MKALVNKNILVISPESWGKSFLSKHYYARELSVHNRVWFLNPPYAGSDPAYYPFSGNTHLTVLSDHHIRGMKHLPVWLQKKLITKQIRKLEKDAGTKFDVIWNFDNSRYFHLDCFRDALTIHHVVDDHMDYNFSAATGSANICFGVTKEITARLHEFNSNAHCIGHGFAPFEYTSARLEKHQGKTSAAYVGNLMLKAFDARLMETLSHELPDTDFYLIGSYSIGNLNASLNAQRVAEIEALSVRPNIHLLGEKSPEDAFTLASQTDVQLALYFNSGPAMTNSSKLPFYFYNGNVVAANYFTAYEGSGLLRMCKSGADFPALLRDTMNHLHDWNSAENRNVRRAYALQNTYGALLEKMDQLIIKTVS